MLKLVDLVGTDRKAATALLRALDAFTEVRGTIPTQYVRAFLLIALDEGKTVGEYAMKSGVAQSVMSRHVLDLSDSSRRVNEPGMDLVLVKMNPNNRREHNVYLTPKGKVLLTKLIRQLEF
jgi:DNA-binding MarR family transcriptional regulator